MKKKALSVILISVVLGIWVLIMFRVYRTYFDETAPVSNVVLFHDQTGGNKLSYLDSFELSLDYKDPFLKGSVNPLRADVNRIQNRIRPEIKKKETPKLKPQIIFPDIKYLGNMINSSNQQIKAIVFIENKEYVLSGGEEIGQLVIKKIDKEFIQVQKEKEIRTYDLQMEK